MTDEKEETEIDPFDDWHLDSITIEFKRDGYDNPIKGHYEGRVQFQNGQFDRFSFKLNERMTQPYIDIISDDIVKSANHLGDKILKSLGLIKKESD